MNVKWLHQNGKWRLIVNYDDDNLEFMTRTHPTRRAALVDAGRMMERKREFQDSLETEEAAAGRSEG